MKFRCYSCRLRPEPGQPRARKVFFEFEADAPVCPKCGASGGRVIWLTDIHFLVPDPKGPLEGKNGRYRVGCDAKRDVLAVAKAPGEDYEDDHVFSATPNPKCVTCPSCKGLPLFAELLKVATRVKAAARRRTAKSGGCC